jgi:hypothetical protein
MLDGNLIPEGFASKLPNIEHRNQIRQESLPRQTVQIPPQLS